MSNSLDFRFKKEIKFKRFSDKAVTPTYSRVGDAALDLTAATCEETDRYIEYKTNIGIKIPEGYFGLIAPRSSLSNYDLILSNHLGIVDSNFVGDISFRFKRTKPEGKIYDIGDRVGQLIILPYQLINLTEVDELEETNRGTQGYGSSGA